MGVLEVYRPASPGPYCLKPGSLPVTVAMPLFTAKIVVPESVTDPLAYYLNNRPTREASVECAVRGGVEHFQLFLNGGGLW